MYAAATRRTMPFDAVANFTHMGMLVEAPMVLVVRAASPYQTLEQYVTAARTKAVLYGTSGIGSAMPGARWPRRRMWRWRPDGLHDGLHDAPGNNRQHGPHAQPPRRHP